VSARLQSSILQRDGLVGAGARSRVIRLGSRASETQLECTTTINLTALVGVGSISVLVDLYCSG